MLFRSRTCHKPTPETTPAPASSPPSPLSSPLSPLPLLTRCSSYLSSCSSHTSTNKALCLFCCFENNTSGPPLRCAPAAAAVSARRRRDRFPPRLSPSPASPPPFLPDPHIKRTPQLSIALFSFPHLSFLHTPNPTPAGSCLRHPQSRPNALHLPLPLPLLSLLYVPRHPPLLRPTQR